MLHFFGVYISKAGVGSFLLSLLAFLLVGLTSEWETSVSIDNLHLPPPIAQLCICLSALGACEMIELAGHQLGVVLV